MTNDDQETVRQLLTFLPFFERPGLDVGGARAEQVGDTLTIYPAEYVDELYSFFARVVPPFADRDYLSKPVDQWLQHPTFLENSSPEQLRTILTWFCRGERFCLGFWEAHFNNGNLLRALRRLQVLEDCDFYFDAAAAERVLEQAKSYTAQVGEVIEMQVVNADGSPMKVNEPNHGG